MAIQQTPKLTGKPQPPVDHTINDFHGGVNSLLDESRTPENAARDVTNLMQKQDGLWSNRWGTLDYGAAFTGPVDGKGTATKNNGDGTFTQYLLIVDNGVLKRSLDGGSWTTIALDASASAFTVGYHADMLQIASRVYISNGKDKLQYYDIALDKQYGFAGLTTPAASTPARSTTLAAGSYNVYYKISAVNSVGETPAGAENAAYTVNKPRDTWVTNTSGSDYVDLTWTAVTNALRYNIYYSDQSGQEVYLDSVSGTAYRDDASASANDFIAAPVGDTTTGPIFSRMGLSDNRLWATGDPNNPWRVYWSGTGQYQGAFSPFYGGGYIDLEKGSGERPTQVKHYRDGKGDAVTQVFTTNQDGTGSEWHITLSNTTIGNVSFLTPSASKIVGSVGTNAPDGAIEARNNLYFVSSRGIFTTGSKPSLLNVLSTDEISVNIRPDVRNINNAQTSKIVGIYFDGKLFWAVPNGSTNNNEIWILDLERNSWARPWTIAIKGFVSYTSSDGKMHLLALPVAGTKFVEFSESYKTDNGVAISTSYRSGLIHFDKNHRQFAKIKYAYIELARATGTTKFTVSGTKKNKSFGTLGSITISPNVSSIGYSAEAYSAIHYSNPAQVPVTYSQSSTKKRIKVNALLNNIQLEHSSSDPTASFTINQFMLKGHLSNTSDPSAWKN